MAKDADLLKIGHIFAGKYRIVELLGEGGGGGVYRAVQETIDRHVAVKVLSTQLAEHPEMVERFRREAKHVSQLKHPNTITVFDSGYAEGRYYIVMELLEGRTLGRMIGQEGAASLPRALHILDQILRSLAEAHQHGIVHRDLKPDNIYLMELYGEPDFVKVLDFGIAKALESEEKQLTAHGSVFGTPSYMAPEQARGLEVTPATDVYAVGLIFYEMLTGRVAFTGPTLYAILELQVNSPLPPLPTVLAQSPLAHVLHRACEKRPEDRFADASDFLAELRRYAGLSGGMPALARPVLPEAAPEPPPAVAAQTITPEVTMFASPPTMMTRAPVDDTPAHLGGEPDEVRTAPPGQLAVVAPFGAASAPPLCFNTALAGRSQAALDLERAIGGALDGDGSRVVLVHGVKGVGKTALIEQQWERLERLGEATLIRSLVPAEGAPMGALRDVFLALLNTRPDVIEAVGGLLRQGADPTVAAFLAHFFDASYPPPDARFLDEAALAQVSARLLQVILAAARAQPLLLWIDDAHELDGLSLYFIQFILNDAAFELHPIVVILSARSGLVDGLPELIDAVLRMGWEAGSRFVSLDLEPLDAAALEELAAGLIPVEPGLGPWLEEASCGVPEVALACVEHLVASGALSFEGALYRLSGPLSTPPDYLEYAERKLAEITPRDAGNALLFEAVIEWAALLGATATPDRLREGIRRDPRRLDTRAVEAMLDHVQSTQLMVRDEGGALRLRWPLVGALALRRLGASSHAVDLFRLAADTLRRANDDNATSIAGRAGRWSLRGGDVERGVEDLLAAARRSLEEGRVGDARTLAAEAWRAWPEDAWASRPERFELVAAFANAALLLGAPDRVSALVVMVDGAAMESIPRHLHGDLMRAVGMHAWLKGAFERACVELGRAAEWYGSHGEEVARARVLYAHAALTVQMGDSLEAERARLTLQQLTEEPEAEIAAYAGLALGRMLREEERYEEARASLDGAAGGFVALGDRWGQAATALETALTAEAVGNTRDATALLERELALIRASGDLRGMALAQALLARLEARRGRHIPAAELVEAAWAAAAAAQIPEVLIEVLRAVFEVRGMAGAIEDGLGCIADALGLNAVLGVSRQRAHLLLAATAGYIAALRWREAREELRALRQLTTDVALPAWVDQEARAFTNLLASVDQGPPDAVRLRDAVRRLPPAATGPLLLLRRFVEARR